MRAFFKKFTLKGMISPLTLRILIINIITIMVLIGGVFFLGVYKEELIETEQADLKMDTLSMIAFIETAMIKFDKKTNKYILNVPLLQNMFERLDHTIDTHTYIFDDGGKLIADNWDIYTKGYAKEHRERFHNDVISTDDIFMIEKERLSKPLIEAFGSGNLINTTWNADSEEDIILNTTVPFRDPKGNILGAVSVSRGNIFADTVRNARVRFLMICVISIFVTTFLSIYLAQTITKPISKLAHSAHNIRQRRKKTLEEKSLDSRTDEIGDLYHSLEGMTKALFDRMDAIESFAADVSHEIKNPLASIQSAIETISKVKSEEHKVQLLEIIASDVARLDRLISDISNASRVDAEMLRVDFEKIDLSELLDALINIYNNTIQQDATPIEFYNKIRGKAMINGLETRLSQVIQNLLGNALSFTSETNPIKVSLSKEKNNYKISVENLGPSIPETKLAKIFERFYSDRPQGKAQHHMDLNHSGLGLSISKQIIEAHHGKIWAENLKDPDGNAIGARFNILLSQFKAKSD